jgi:hypothetical protein
MTRNVQSYLPHTGNGVGLLLKRTGVTAASGNPNLLFHQF